MKHLKDIMPFGKYKGKTIREVIQSNPRYIQWAVDTIVGFDLSPYAQNYLDQQFYGDEPEDFNGYSDPEFWKY